jgi:sec-independent protein translocase protein TatA
LIVHNAIGGQEVILIVGAIVLLFGAKKVPEMMRGVGEGMREFKKASKEMQEEDDISSSTQTKANSEPKVENE